MILAVSMLELACYLDGMTSDLEKFIPKKIAQRIRIFISRLLALFILTVILAGCANSQPDEHPIVRQGQLTVPDWNFYENTGLPLAGDWEVIWGELVDPADFDAAYQGDYFHIPGRWNVKAANSNPRHLAAIDRSYGVASFRAKLVLPEHQKALSFFLISPHASWQLFVDGKRVGGNGIVSKDKEVFRANYTSRVLAAKGGESTLVLQVANYTHAYGGPGHAITMWDARNLRKTLDFLSLYYILTLGILFTIGMFHLIVYLADRRHRENGPVHLWFGVLCLVIVYRISGTIPYFYIYFPAAEYWATLRFSYISLFLAPAVYLLFFKTAFPKIFPKKFTNALIAICFIGTIASLVLPENLYTHSRNYAIILNLLAVMLTLVFTMLAWRKKYAGAGAILIANFLFSLTAINDALIYSDYGNGFDLTPFGILCIGIGYSYALLLRLQSSFNQARNTSLDLEVLNRDLEKQVSERTRSFKAAAAKAENSSQEQARFVAAASHDLRQPLHALSLFNLALKRRLQTKAKPQAVLDAVEKQEIAINNLSDLLQDTLDTTALDIGQKLPSLSRVRPKHILTEITSGLKAQYAPQNIVLSSAADTGDLTTDKNMLKRILGNLIDNACKAARTRVDITARREKSGWAFRVQDDGLGISQDNIDKIFAPYISSDDNPGPQGGYGLGLYVVNEFTKALGGTIKIEHSSTQGSTFKLFLPDKPTGASKETTVKPDPKFSLSGLKILAVDDEPKIIEALEALLGEWHCTVKTATNQAQALTFIDEGFVPGVLLIDYHLHGITGLELIANIRIETARVIPAIIITGASEPRVLEAIKRANIPYLRKPVHPTALGKMLMKMKK